MNIEVYISNLSEDVWDFIESLKENDKKFEIEENAYLSDREILMLNPASQSIIILPVPVDVAFINYYKRLFANENVEVYVPNLHSGQICKDVQSDPKLWQQLVKLGKSHHLILKSYSASSQFFELVAALKDEGCSISTPESPIQGSEWTANHFGSKSGVRETVGKLTAKTGEKWIADGEVAHTVERAVELAMRYYETKGGVVIKTNKAHSGAGVVIIPPNSISKEEKKNYFQTLFEKEAYWPKFPIVIEEFLDIDVSVGGGNPNCEYMIDETGQLHLLFVCGLRVTKKGIFKGIEIANTIFKQNIISQLLKYGEALGKTYRDNGYRGYFDIDCIYTQSGELLITESNVRRTGGTHLFHTGNILLGKNFSGTHYLLSNNTHPLSTRKEYSFSEVHQILEPLLFTKEKGTGIILAAANILKQHNLSHVIVEKDNKSALALEKEMERLLSID